MAQFPSTTSASGEWTLKKQKRAQQGGNWPSISDPYFPYVTMLLHGDGTNGAQNNTFLDSSSSALSITRTGNPTQGSFSPYGANWSNYFNGSTGYLSNATATAVNVGTGNFTFECWIYRTTSGAEVCLLSAAANSGFQVGLRASDWGFCYRGIAWRVTSTTMPAVNAWSHLAVTRSAGTIYLFLNGTLLTSGANSDNCNQNGFYLASLNGTQYMYTGYISNMRVINGTALYTSSFTPSTTPLTAVSGTSLLTCQSNRFIDNSSNSFTLTVNNTPSVQEFSPFSPTAAYSASTLGGSLYTSASGNVLTAPISSNFDVSSGQGAWTGECWIYPTSFSGYKGIFGNRTNANAGWDATLETSTGNATRFGFYNSGGGSTYASGAQAVILNQWNHVALSSDGTTISHYVNGTRTQTSTASLSYQSGVGFVVGANKPAADEWFAGYMSGFRFVKGTQIYSGTTITVPTSPPTDVSNTKLLMNYTNGAIFDNAMMNDLETVGNAQISTSVVKYGTGSIYLDGSGDWLLGQSSPNMSPGSGAFTMECWVYMTATGSGNKGILTVGNANSTGNALQFIQNGTTLYINDGSGTNTSVGTLSLNTWTHIALVREGTGTNQAYGFINGVKGSTTTYSSTFSSPMSVKVGTTEYGSSANAEQFTGYIDDLRITKGYARYTANFTPPTGPFPNQ